MIKGRVTYGRGREFFGFTLGEWVRITALAVLILAMAYGFLVLMAAFSPARAEWGVQVADAEKPVVVIVPHPDDEMTMLPVIRSAGSRAVVVVMTDGGATGNCPDGMKTADPDAFSPCAAARKAAFEGFMAERAPEAEWVWVGTMDRRLTVEEVVETITALCHGCELWAAGTDYGHPDHNAVRAGVEQMGGTAYNGAMRWDLADFEAGVYWYGWLGVRIEQWAGLYMGLSQGAWE